MALTLVSAQKVRQAATYAVQYGALTAPSSVGALFAVKAFFQDWAMNHANADLQFIPFSGLTSADPGICQDTGFSPIGGVTSTVYFVYAKNDGSGDGTNAYVRLYNDTTNTTNTLAYITGLISDDNDAWWFTSNKGIIFATDLTISADTGTDGTESTAARSANGFVIVGA
jgi:hypothetical protein